MLLVSCNHTSSSTLLRPNASSQPPCSRSDSKPLLPTPAAPPLLLSRSAADVPSRPPPSGRSRIHDRLSFTVPPTMDVIASVEHNAIAPTSTAAEDPWTHVKPKFWWRKKQFKDPPSSRPPPHFSIVETKKIPPSHEGQMLQLPVLLPQDCSV
ncbi:hypothetical protein ABZP36_003409 [Zizania latifolia]